MWCVWCVCVKGSWLCVGVGGCRVWGMGVIGVDGCEGCGWVGVRGMGVGGVGCVW